MSTSSPIAARTPAAWLDAHPVLLCAAWKEYRMLRGFWCGVAALALVEMLVLASLLTGWFEAEWMLISAWGAAAMYAVGAAVTLFAVEREEQTDAYLRLLPRHAGAMLAGKLIAAIVSAFALAAVLIVVGAIIAGELPAAGVAGDITAVGATAVLEFFVWGVLASLVCPQPLLAAVIGIAAASVAIQLAVAGASQTQSGIVLVEYREAIFWRLVIAAAVGALDVWLGLRWLQPLRPRTPREQRAEARESSNSHIADSRVTAAASLATTTTAPRRRVFFRLLWQSWREGWQAMLAVLPVAIFLMLAEGLLMGMLWRSVNIDLPVLSSLCVIPAMYGALAFRADQRGQRYRFLAEHAVSPRLVWAARHAAWLVPLVLAAAAVHIAAWWLVRYELDMRVTKALVESRNTGWPSPSESPYAIGLQADFIQRTIFSVGALFWAAWLAAYACGQLCSMAIRSTVLAGFAALACSVVITWWSILAGFWQLPASLFVAPLAVAALAATLVRCRAWITERRGLRHWFVPAALVAVALVLIARSVGPARSAQAAGTAPPGKFTRESLAEILARWESQDKYARAVARRYEQLATEFDHAAFNAQHAPDVLPGMDGGVGPRIDMTVGAAEPVPGANSLHVNRSGRGWWLNVDAELLESSQNLFAQLAALTQEQRCRFDVAEVFRNPLGRGTADRALNTLATYLVADAQRHIDAGNLDAALERLLTLRRMEAHSRQYQPMSSYRDSQLGGLRTLGGGSSIDQGGLLLRWATAPGQTSARLRRAADELLQAEKMFPDFSEVIVANYSDVRQVVAGDKPPTFVVQRRTVEDEPTTSQKLAFYMNELPWERRRAFAALDRMTEAELDYAAAVTSGLSPINGGAHLGAYANAAEKIRELINFNAWSPTSSLAPLGEYYGWLEILHRQRVLDAARTSLLPEMERAYHGSLTGDLRWYLRLQAQRRGEIQRLLLLAYRLDHGKYPASLLDLTPDYAPSGALVDPITTQPLVYHPAGFELPLATEDMYGPEQFIPAGTPLLWSVGPSDVEPQERWAIVAPEGGRSRLAWWNSPPSEVQLDAARDFTAQHVYLLVPMGLYTPDRNPILLPLPKIEPPAEHGDAEETD